MSTPIDVPAFFDDCISYLSSQDNLAGYEVEQATLARAAVAELIEAAEQVHDVCRDQEDWGRLYAALARVKGASA